MRHMETYKGSRRAVRELTRYSLAPLVARMGTDEEGEPKALKTLAREMGLTVERLKRAYEEGGLDPYAFDWVCVKALGTHPGHILGFAEWANYEAKWAGEIFEKKVDADDEIVVG